MDRKEIIHHLYKTPLHELSLEADKVRRKYCGDGILVRGIIDFSNVCVRNCLYCGLRKDNTKLSRYRMSIDEILKCADEIALKGIKTVVLQSGDDFHYTCDTVCMIIKSIKNKYPGMAVTLSIGERPYKEYKMFKNCGADRYLLKHETANMSLYSKYHPGMSYFNRILTLSYLRGLGFQVGAGLIAGLPGQSLEDIADDICFIEAFRPDMAAVGPFIPQENTPLAGNENNNAELALKALALIRIVSKNAHIPAATAFANANDINGKNAQIAALESGANVIMPDFTPQKYSKNYLIYNRKTENNLQKIISMCSVNHLKLSFTRGDSLAA